MIKIIFLIFITISPPPPSVSLFFPFSLPKFSLFPSPFFLSSILSTKIFSLPFYLPIFFTESPFPSRTSTRTTRCPRRNYPSRKRSWEGSEASTASATEASKLRNSESHNTRKNEPHLRPFYSVSVSLWGMVEYRFLFLSSVLSVEYLYR